MLNWIRLSGAKAQFTLSVEAGSAASLQRSGLAEGKALCTRAWLFHTISHCSLLTTGAPVKALNTLYTLRRTYGIYPAVSNNVVKGTPVKALITQQWVKTQCKLLTSGHKHSAGESGASTKRQVDLWYSVSNKSQRFTRCCERYTCENSSYTTMGKNITTCKLLTFVTNSMPNNMDSTYSYRYSLGMRLVRQFFTTLCIKTRYHVVSLYTTLRKSYTTSCKLLTLLLTA